MGGCELLSMLGTDRPEVEIRTSSTTGQEQPRRLGVGDFRDAIQQSMMLCDFPLQKFLHEIKMPERHTKHLEPLLVRGESGVSSPNDSAGTCQSGGALQPNASWREGPTPVPHFRFASEIMYLPYPSRGTYDVQIVQVRQEFFAFFQLCSDCGQSWVLPQAEDQGHQRITLLPAFTLGNVDLT